MQKIESYNSNLGVAILLVGGAGTGKTVLGMRLFPKTYVFVADPNFDSGKRFLEKQNELGNIVGFNYGNFDESGKVIPVAQRYDWMFKCLNAATTDPSVECIFLDSATFVEDYIKAKICNAQTEVAIRLSGFEQWGTLMLTWKGLVLQLRQSGKKTIMAAHEKKEKDESDQIFKYKISVDGQIADKFPALFSDVWRTEIGEPSPGKPQWQIRPLSNVRQEHLKNTYGMTQTLPVDEVMKIVRAQTK